MNKTPLILLITALLFSPLHAVEMNVGPNGSDQASGTPSAPLQTIQAAFDKASPGDTILLHAGTYREAVSLKNKSGTEGAPITLVAAKGEKPVISGLDVLKLEWKETPQPGIFVAPLDTNSIAQLFYEGKPMLEARWPHCPRDTNGDWNFFSPAMWADADTTGNSYGTLACATLAKTGWDVTGAKALLNVDHQFFCWTRPVLTGAAGSGVITYTQDLGKSVDKPDETGVKGKWNQRNKFYLFGLKQFLGAPGEWFYDSAAKQLYLCSPDGKNPSEGLLEIKNRPWGFTADETCNFLTIDGVGFFGTAFRFGNNPKKRSSHIVLRNSSILHSSWTEYLSTGGSGEKGADQGGTDSIFPTMMVDNSQVVNCVFAYGSQSALLINGWNNLIENNLFHDFDYSSSLVYPPLQVNLPGDGLAGQAGHAVIRYNTISRSGGIQARMAQASNEFTMNDVHDSYLAAYGGNKDTSAVYTQRPSAVGTRFHHNWVHEGFSGTPPLPWGGGMGIRGDDLTCGLTVDHNVVWDCGSVGIFIKNVDQPTPEQANRCVNNTVFGHSAYNDTKSAIIIPTVGGKSKKNQGEPDAANGPLGENPNAWSTVANNLADSIYGQWNAHPLGKVKLDAANDTSFNAGTDLVSTNWYDFRPVSGAAAILGKGIAVEGLSPVVGTNPPDIGAYQRGEVTYWIPGRREAKATYPIVPDKATGVPAERDILMWRPAYGATAHTVTFSTSEAGLDQNTPSTITKTFQGEANVLPLPPLAAATTYYWRVDAVMPDKSVVKGDVWSFATK